MTDADLGAALPLPVPSAEMQDRLARRRSAPAQALTGPGPSRAEIERILLLGARTPDHGKLFPWRFVVMGPQSRADLAAALTPLAARQADPGKAAKVLSKLTAPPLSILVLSVPIPGHKVPEWEQQLSAGAVCMNLEHAANALGFAASWITDWYSYDTDALALYDVRAGERVAGFIHIGTLAEPPLERPRPDVTALTTWRD
ncbi:MAG: nitroreductase [Alphaproteobacteria bacterium]|jgi:nitroreductase|nr:nitroreductase [Alphaproteobacteria bacterium]MBU2041802.1 nitroreductase [Alphaproteobacteria bacterium]MBU2125872.1 nitroreductase [Alphaproteobacteria bacterium]MBU2208974.1 nitroreductase [Alphaproteobacteria bacterium]MBU2290204.1 nitroreductase [Alphaproteobacteria bacterium]